MQGGASFNQLDSSLGNHMTGAYEGTEGVFGGCDAKYGMGGFVAVLLLVTAMLLLYYVATFLTDLKKAGGRENLCGGKDEGCICDGNEMMSGGVTMSGKKTSSGSSKWVTRDVSEDSLSMVGSGL